MRSVRAFTLVELLITVVVIGILISLLAPSLGAMRRAAVAVKCLANMRNMEVAHWGYMSDHRDRFIKVGLPHGSSAYDESAAWINTLEEYYGSRLLHRSPADDSPHWGPNGQPVPGTNPPRFRMTSYGVNNYLDDATCPDAVNGPYLKLRHIRKPSRTVHFVYMAENGEFAGADHPHVENWVGSIPVKAANHLEIHAHGGSPRSWDAVTNYGFLDGHAETLPFRSVYSPDGLWNLFDPQKVR